MRRDVPALANTEYDLLVVGGGIFGACAAWDAVLRGYSVALIERADFGSGASANSYKMVHGGIRYLQHGDIARVRESCHERSALLRVAPHLVQPLPIVIPTYGHGREGKGFLGAGMLVYDMLTLGRNRGIADPKRRIPRSKFMGRREVLELFPDLHQEKLTGAAVFCDGQMYNPTRLVLAFLQSAAAQGAVLANYVEAAGFVRTGDRIGGVAAHDRLSGERFDIRAKCVLNAAGGWAEDILASDGRVTPARRGTWSRDACFVIKRRFAGPHALAVQGRTRDPESVFARPARHLFVVPWRDYSLIGVWHKVYRGNPDDVDVSDQDLESFIDEINWACPALNLTPEDVMLCNAGLVPFGENDPDAVHLRYGKHSRLIDHERDRGIAGLVSLMGIRYTMARHDAATAIDLIGRKLDAQRPSPATDTIPIHGGAIDDFDVFAAALQANAPFPLADRVARALAHNHGTASDTVLQHAQSDPMLAQALGHSTVLGAEIRHAVRNEMAMTLTDLVFRRTDLGTGGHPGDRALAECAEIAAAEFGWSRTRADEELNEVTRRFPPTHASLQSKAS